MEANNQDVPAEVMLEIHKQLNLSYQKMNDMIKQGDRPSVGFDKAIEHFRNEFIRIKIEQYRRIERDAKAFNEMVLNYQNITKI